MNNDELIEAEKICGRALEKVEAALTHLKSAKRWGTFDLWGGGFLTSYFKTKKIEKAEVEIGLLHEALRKLNDSSEEVRYALDGFETLTNLQKTLDIGLDDIYTNWKNQAQVKRNISLLEALHGNLIDLEKDLSSKHV